MLDPGAVKETAPLWNHAISNRHSQVSADIGGRFALQLDKSTNISGNERFTSKGNVLFRKGIARKKVAKLHRCSAAPKDLQTGRTRSKWYRDASFSALQSCFQVMIGAQDWPIWQICFHIWMTWTLECKAEIKTKKKQVQIKCWDLVQRRSSGDNMRKVATLRCAHRSYFSSSSPQHPHESWAFKHYCTKDQKKERERLREGEGDLCVSLSCKICVMAQKGWKRLIKRIV